MLLPPVRGGILIGDEAPYVSTPISEMPERPVPFSQGSPPRCFVGTFVLFSFQRQDTGCLFRSENSARPDSGKKGQDPYGLSRVTSGASNLEDYFSGTNIFKYFSSVERDDAISVEIIIARARGVHTGYSVKYRLGTRTSRELGDCSPMFLGGRRKKETRKTRRALREL